MSIENLIGKTEELIFKIGQQVPYKDLHTTALSLVKDLYSFEHQLQQNAGGNSKKEPGREATIEEQRLQIEKAKRKLPVWANNQKSMPAKILAVYYTLKKDYPKTVIDKALLVSFFEKFNDDPLACSRNFDQMKNFGDKNHAKIFDVKSNGEIIIWPPIEEFVRAYYESVGFVGWDELMKRAYPSYKGFYDNQT